MVASLGFNLQTITLSFNYQTLFGFLLCTGLLYQVSVYMLINSHNLLNRLGEFKQLPMITHRMTSYPGLVGTWNFQMPKPGEYQKTRIVDHPTLFS